MRFIPTRFHGMLDYVVGIILIISPWLFDFSDVSAATWVVVVAGVLALLQTVMTDFEAGIIHKIPMKTHLMTDFVLGVILALSPWIFGFVERVYAPHLIFGVFSILASLTTHRVPSETYRRLHPQHDTIH